MLHSCSAGLGSLHCLELNPSRGVVGQGYYKSSKPVSSNPCAKHLRASLALCVMSLCVLPLWAGNNQPVSSPVFSPSFLPGARVPHRVAAGLLLIHDTRSPLWPCLLPGAVAFVPERETLGLQGPIPAPLHLQTASMPPDRQVH